jgi:hypothetical protein
VQITGLNKQAEYNGIRCKVKSIDQAPQVKQKMETN